MSKIMSAAVGIDLYLTRLVVGKPGWWLYMVYMVYRCSLTRLVVVGHRYS
jgi:hypothetical protein